MDDNLVDSKSNTLNEHHFLRMKELKKTNLIEEGTIPVGMTVEIAHFVSILLNTLKEFYMTSSMQKKNISQSWNMEKVQEAATKMVATQIVTRLAMLEKHSGEEATAMEKESAQKKAELMKEIGVKTPLDLVNHMAEFEVNMFGAKASVEGDENNATLFNEKPTIWLEAKKMSNMTPEQEQTMQSHHKQWIADLAENLGFKATVECAEDGNSEKIVFTR